MTVNKFFPIIALLLVVMFFAFRPITVEKPDSTEIAELDLQSFTIYELDRNGLVRMMYGDEGQRFKQKRYEVKNIAYTDSRGKFTQDMTADSGEYRLDTMTLTGNVQIRRSDGLEITADAASYNQHKGVVKTSGPFHMSQSGSSATGNNLVYHTESGHVKAKTIKANYQMPEQGNQ
ncbi:MAG: LPS export ABC transporter periplasmic protein LptC [Sulfurimonadaceae bacterium]|nr:LPS export ABC transporter periplasmic protein LptC [Sulfurimonadaceae bacterium]